MFLFIAPGEFILSETTSLGSTPDTFDVRFSALAKNKEALTLMKFINNFAEKDEAVEFFATYLGAFYPADSEERRNLMLTDPMVRVWSKNEKLRSQLCKLLGSKFNEYPVASAELKESNARCLADYTKQSIIDAKKKRKEDEKAAQKGYDSYKKNLYVVDFDDRALINGGATIPPHIADNMLSTDEADMNDFDNALNNGAKSE